MDKLTPVSHSICSISRAAAAGRRKCKLLKDGGHANSCIAQVDTYVNFDFESHFALFQLHFQITHETETEHHHTGYKLAIIQTISEQDCVEVARGMEETERKKKGEQMKKKKECNEWALALVW